MVPCKERDDVSTNKAGSASRVSYIGQTLYPGYTGTVLHKIKPIAANYI